jgi:hypothetical protein
VTLFAYQGRLYSAAGIGAALAREGLPVAPAEAGHADGALSMVAELRALGYTEVRPLPADQLVARRRGDCR